MPCWMMAGFVTKRSSPTSWQRPPILFVMIQIGAEGVLRLARAVRDDGAVAGALRQLDRLQRLGQRAHLVHLDEDGVRKALTDALLDDGGVRDEEVVAHELAAPADPLRHDPDRRRRCPPSRPSGAR